MENGKQNGKYCGVRGYILGLKVSGKASSPKNQVSALSARRRQEVGTVRVKGWRRMLGGGSCYGQRMRSFDYKDPFVESRRHRGASHPSTRASAASVGQAWTSSDSSTTTQRLGLPFDRKGPSCPEPNPEATLAKCGRARLRH